MNFDVEHGVRCNEIGLQYEVSNYLKANGWEVKEYVKRKDTVNWQHSYEADMIIRHQHYPLLGWIGLELKDTPHEKTGGTALKQIVTKYQNHYFEGIDQPIHCWVIITNQKRYDYIAYVRTCEQFGVAYFDWGSRIKNCEYKKVTKNYGGQYPPYTFTICNFNLVKLISEAGEGAMCLEANGMDYYEFNEVRVINFLASRTDFVKHINLSNMKFLEPIKKEDDKLGFI